MKICHLTSLHIRYDTRIFVKQCCSLAKIGHSVTLIVSDGKGDEIVNDVTIIDVGKAEGTKDRLLRVNKLIFSRAIELDAEYYFYHDPELSIQAVSLTNAGKKVIYDAHEDSPRQYISNAPNKGVKTKLISSFIQYLENRAARKIHGMLTATEGIKSRYDRYNANVEVVKNYPIVDELVNDRMWEERRHQACYIGGLRDTRGIIEIIRACHKSNIPLKLAGPWQPKEFQNIAENEEGWHNTEYLGFLNRREIANLLAESRIGFLTLYKTPNHIHALPVKMYEYMVSGVPVIASDIDLWQQIINDSNCGTCVDPQSVNDISGAIDYILGDTERALHLSENGKKSVLEKYNWNIEIQKIFRAINN